MSLIRPEIAHGLSRWFSATWEAVLVAALASLGIWRLLVAVTPVGQGVGILLLLLAGLAIVTFRQRARFRRGRGGPGVVQIDEGRISYFGPDGGGFVALNLLSGIDLLDHGRTWWLTQEGGEAVAIPTTASGTQALFDVFASLPGFDMPATLKALEGPQSRRRLIWAKSETGTVHLLN